MIEIMEKEQQKTKHNGIKNGEPNSVFCKKHTILCSSFTGARAIIEM